MQYLKDSLKSVYQTLRNRCKKQQMQKAMLRLKNWIRIFGWRNLTLSWYEWLIMKINFLFFNTKLTIPNSSTSHTARLPSKMKMSITRPSQNILHIRMGRWLPERYNYLFTHNLINMHCFLNVFFIIEVRADINKQTWIIATKTFADSATKTNINLFLLIML